MRTVLILSMTLVAGCSSARPQPSAAQPRNTDWMFSGTPDVPDWPFPEPEWLEPGPAENPDTPQTSVHASLIEGEEQAVRDAAAVLSVGAGTPVPVDAEKWQAMKRLVEGSTRLRLTRLPRIILFEDQSASVGLFKGYPRYASGFELFAMPAGLSAPPREIRYAVQTVRYADESRRPETMRRWAMEHVSDHPSGELRGCLLECLDDGPPALLVVDVCDVDAPLPAGAP